MAYEIEIALIYGTCLTLIATACAVAYYASIANQERIRQAGIDRRAGTNPTPNYAGKDWYVPVLVELSKSPQVVEMLTKLAPQLIEMFNKKPPQGS